MILIPAAVPLALLTAGALVAAMVLARLLREDTVRCLCGADARCRPGDTADDRDGVVIVIVPHCTATGMSVVIVTAPASTVV